MLFLLGPRGADAVPYAPALGGRGFIRGPVPCGQSSTREEERIDVLPAATQARGALVALPSDACVETELLACRNYTGP
jgi:hypothetical protein